MKELESLDVEDKRIFLRGDIDVPIRNGVIEDFERLEILVTTIRYLLEKNCRILLAGHISRPKNNQDFNLSTRILLTTLTKLLNIQVVHFSGFNEVNMTSTTLGLFENLRFWEGEEKNDEDFAKQLASLADVYVNEAFAASHREHASIVGVPKFLPHAAGLRLQKEVKVLTQVLKNPTKPQLVIIGGVKLETKLPVIEVLSKTADLVLVGGLIAKVAKQKNVKVADNVIFANLTPNGKDIDESSIEKFCEQIGKARQIILNGAMGIFEEESNERGTREIALAVASSGAEKIVGGDATIFALKKFGLLDKMDWVSTGGGAMLEFLAKGTLPGIEALM